LFLLLAFPSCLIAQKYVPFPTDNAEWNVMQVVSSDTGLEPDTMLIQYSLQGDTTINGIAYRKLCQKTGTVDRPFYVVGGLREQDKKIYVVEPDWGYSNDEILLYDFNKQVGDTLKIEGRINYIVTGIDSIKIGNEFRKRYKIKEDYSDAPAYIIEGIGNVSFGLLESIIPIPTGLYSAYREFICFSQNNGETVYLNPAFMDCNSTVKTGLKDITATGQSVKIYPNPAKDYVQFQFDYPNAQNTSVEIMDYTGREVETVPVQGLSNYTLNLSSYSPGVYFVVVRSAEGSEVHKIIKM